MVCYLVLFFENCGGRGFQVQLSVVSRDLAERGFPLGHSMGHNFHHLFSELFQSLAVLLCLTLILDQQGKGENGLNTIAFALVVMATKSQLQDDRIVNDVEHDERTTQLRVCAAA